DNPEVAGKGVRYLKASGCDVKVGILEQESKIHHKRFFTFHNKKRPYIILKWAQTQDGFIAPYKRNKKAPVWISNSYSRQLVHKWRAEEQAILVGANTVLQDNPSLTVRDWEGQNPTRIIIDKQNTLKKTFTVFNDDANTIHLTSKEIDFSSAPAQQICDALHKNTITSLIVEGGAKTLQQFINEGLWDEARVFVGNMNFKNGIKAPLFNGKLISEEPLKTDLLKRYVHD
ncbi:MAG: bifunctional diaminohydroxyphosphoribosylaminopyrimidine deaminase/5-amino-6-(5-phosphoribosylamino)uracil reductase, partial [Winogradskyella sp.]|nr:bifunctional diaminohydroxyphosphoribosylaminopyrimidine deaminase/5-amino-6-(5-phosphoribosylamino)uracil reductase [Winogradskyella sp.]